MSTSAASRRSRWLLLMALVAALALPACSAVPDTFACQHCVCGTAPRSVSRPMRCTTVGREAACCMPIFLGS